MAEKIVQLFKEMSWIEIRDATETLNELWKQKQMKEMYIKLISEWFAMAKIDYKKLLETNIHSVPHKTLAKQSLKKNYFKCSERWICCTENIFGNNSLVSCIAHDCPWINDEYDISEYNGVYFKLVINPNVHYCSVCSLWSENEENNESMKGEKIELERKLDDYAESFIKLLFP